MFPFLGATSVFPWFTLWNTTQWDFKLFGRAARETENGQESQTTAFLTQVVPQTYFDVTENLIVQNIIYNENKKNS